MPGSKSKFKESWLDLEDSNNVLIKKWCARGRNESEAYCGLCKVYFSIANSGKSQILKHSSTVKHSQTTKRLSSNHTILSVLGSSSVPNQLNSEQQILKSEIIWCLKIVQSNFSFSSSKDITDIFHSMFPDSMIAQRMQLSERKLSYMVTYGIGKYFEEQLIKELKKSVANEFDVCSIAFDESTTAQIKKQLDIYIKFWSRTTNKVENAYLTSTFLGHADAETLKACVISALKQKQVQLSKLLMISMDGPNVNKLVKKKINDELKVQGASELVDVGTCPIHVIHNAFAAGIKILDFEIDDFASDLHGFFKSSAARREDFSFIQDILDLDNRNFIRHVSSRWLTLEPVVRRIIEQYDAVKEYFLKHIEKCSSKEVLQSNRYRRIRNTLKDSCTLPYLHFILFLAPIFSEFLAVFQTEALLIHILYIKMNELLLNILTKFVKMEYILNKEGAELKELDLKNNDIFLLLKNMDIGTATRKSLMSVDENNRKRLLFNFRQSYLKIASYLLEKMPLSNQLLKDVGILNPLTRNKVGISSAIMRLCSHLKPLRYSDKDVDKIMQEWNLYNLETIPETAYTTNDTSDGEEKVIYERIDVFWSRIFQVMNINTGEPKYANLAKLVKPCLMLYHGNSDVERGFSVNKSMLAKDRCNLGEKNYNRPKAN